jgi:hypothetical protein
MICNNGEAPGLNRNLDNPIFDANIILQGSTCLVTHGEFKKIDHSATSISKSGNDVSRMATRDLYLEMRAQLLALTEEFFLELKQRDGPKSLTDGEPVLNLKIFKQWLN